MRKELRHPLLHDLLPREHLDIARMCQTQL